MEICTPLQNQILLERVPQHGEDAGYIFAACIAAVQVYVSAPELDIQALGDVVVPRCRETSSDPRPASRNAIRSGPCSVCSRQAAINAEAEFRGEGNDGSQTGQTALPFRCGQRCRRTIVNPYQSATRA